MTNSQPEKYRLIIVENDDDERLFMKEGFDESGRFEILAMLKNGDMLLEWLATHPERPHLVLSDLNMPGKNGHDIIEMMRNYEGHYTPVIITSTSTTPSIIERCLNEGAADYIIKPETFIEYRGFAEQLFQRIRDKNLADGH